MKTNPKILKKAKYLDANKFICKLLYNGKIELISIEKAYQFATDVQRMRFCNRQELHYVMRIYNKNKSMSKYGYDYDYEIFDNFQLEIFISDVYQQEQQK